MVGLHLGKLGFKGPTSLHYMRKCSVKFEDFIMAAHCFEALLLKDFLIPKYCNQTAEDRQACIDMSVFISLFIIEI